MADDLGIGAVLDAAFAPFVAERDALAAERDALAVRLRRAEMEDRRQRGGTDRRRAALEEALRAAKRQAAPFRRRGRKAEPGRPGRQPGHAAANRPVPDPVDEQLFAPLRGCPCCGGDVEDIVNLPPQYVIGLPPEIRLWVRRFHTQSGYCRRCRRRVRSRHREQHATATGAAGAPVGPRALALGVDLTGRSSAPTSPARLASTAGPAIAGSCVARARATAICSGGRASPSKCRSAALPASRTPSSGSSSTPWQSSVSGTTSRPKTTPLSVTRYVPGSSSCSRAASRNPANRRFAQHLRDHQDELCAFLEMPGLAPTNRLGEQEIQPAVVVRKISAGNRTLGGAHVHEITASVSRTAERSGPDLALLLPDLLRAPEPYVLPLLPAWPRPAFQEEGDGRRLPLRQSPLRSDGRNGRPSGGRPRPRPGADARPPPS